MPLTPEQIKALTDFHDPKEQEFALSELDRINLLVIEMEKQLKEAKELRQRRMLLAFDAGIPQSVIADLLHVSRQHISNQIYIFRLKHGIPEGITLLDHEERMAYIEKLGSD